MAKSKQLQYTLPSIYFDIFYKLGDDCCKNVIGKELNIKKYKLPKFFSDLIKI